MYYKNKIILLFIFCCICLVSTAQDTTADYATAKVKQEEFSQQPIQPNSFDKEEWKKLKQKLKIKDYKPEKIDTTSATDSLTTKSDSLTNKKSWTQNISPQSVKIIQWFIFGGIFLLLVFIILRVLGVQLFIKDNKKASLQISLEELEENLDTAAIDPHLHNAIKSKNFKLAIRLYYLMIIQRLALKEKIVWKKHKTNRHYLNELKDKNEHDTLKKLTFLYEHSWFGEAEITENDYNRINPDFVNFLHAIN